MVPYFQYNSFLIGPLTIQVWGLFVAAGITAAVILMTRLTRRYLLSEQVILDMTIWILIGSFLFARLFHIVFYNLDYFLLYPVDALKFWQGGLSSLGGFFGAGLAIWAFAKLRHFKLSELWQYFDVMALGLWLGWGIGRLGCFFIHDHPGTLSHFVLAVKFPEGARFDLGLFESIVGFVLFAVFMLLRKRLKIGSGLIAIYSSIGYAVIRFFLDFLRATDLPGSDARYGALTPAQWGMLVVALALTSFVLSTRIRRTPAE